MPKAAAPPSEAVQVEYMGFWIRFLALLIDTIILSVVALALAVITSGVSVTVQRLSISSTTSSLRD